MNTALPERSCDMRKKGFTLIELLVVIAIIALLLAILLPGLNKAKQIAAAAVCLSNNNQLGKAYFMFSEENKGALADGQPAKQCKRLDYYNS